MNQFADLRNRESQMADLKWGKGRARFEKRSDRLIGGVAEGGQGALGAQGVAREADFSAKPDYLMTERNPAVLRHQLHQVLLDFFRRRLLGQFQAVGDAEDMGIHHHAARDAEGRSQYHVGGFSCYAGQGEQLFHGAGNLSAELLHDPRGGADDAFRLVAEEPGGMNFLLQLFLRQGYEILGEGYLRKSSGVTLFTRSSVHWAERMVATRSWKAFSCRSAHSARGNRRSSAAKIFCNRAGAV